MRRIFLSLSLLLGFFALFVVLSSYTHDNQGSTSISVSGESVSLPQIIQAVDIPYAVDFCGEPFPMEHFDVKERLDKELISNSYRHSGTILYLKRAARFFPTIEKILAENGMPDDLKYLAVAESGLENATSPAGAKGYWQFMKATGRSYGLTITSEVDERMHLEKSTRAACKYLTKLKNQFGSWTLAAAAYNMGETGLKKNLASQKSNSLFDLNLNSETMRYVFRIAAIKEIMKNPRNFGFYIDDHHKYAPFPECYNIEVKGSVSSWATWASQNGMSYRELKIYNPWLKDSQLINKERKTYYVKVPKKE